MATRTAAQVIGIATALLASGGIATLSLFDVPELQSQPASRSLPMTRWLFSRGSHIFPSASLISSGAFAYLAFNTEGAGQLSNLLSLAMKGGKVSGYLAASVLCFSIAPWTAVVMIPTNFELIKQNEKLGGARSAESAEKGGAQPREVGEGLKAAEDSVNAKTEGNEQFGDSSGPQSKTARDSSGGDDRKVKELLGKFGMLNDVRAVLMGVGGLVGLVTALG